MGFPGATSGKEPACQCRRYKRGIVNPWVGKIPWRRAWLPTPVFLPGKSHGWRSLAGYSPWGHTELDTTEWLSTHSGTEVVDYRLRLFSSSLVLHPSCWTKTLCLWLIPLFPSAFRPWKPSFCSPSPWVWLFWMSHRGGIRQPLCPSTSRLTSFSMLSSRFTHIAPHLTRYYLLEIYRTDISSSSTLMSMCHFILQITHSLFNTAM